MYDEDKQRIMFASAAMRALLPYHINSKDNTMSYLAQSAWKMADHMVNEGRKHIGPLKKDENNT